MTTQTQHTAGPWRVAPYGTVITDTGLVVADHMGRANAELISSAPDLLAFAKYVLEYASTDNQTKRNNLNAFQLEKAAREVIAKAEGRV